MPGASTARERPYASREKRPVKKDGACPPRTGDSAPEPQPSPPRRYSPTQKKTLTEAKEKGKPQASPRPPFEITKDVHTSQYSGSSLVSTEDTRLLNLEPYWLVWTWQLRLGSPPPRSGRRRRQRVFVGFFAFCFSSTAFLSVCSSLWRRGRRPRPWWQPRSLFAESCGGRAQQEVPALGFKGELRENPAPNWVPPSCPAVPDRALRLLSAGIMERQQNNVCVLVEKKGVWWKEWGACSLSNNFFYLGTAEKLKWSGFFKKIIIKRVPEIQISPRIS